MTDPDPIALRDLAVRAAEAAGALLMGAFLGERQILTKTSPTDPVTEMDRAAEQLIVDMLLRERPHDGVLGEEGSERRGTSGVRWVLDPLDGTVNYVYRIPAFAVCIAAEVNGQAVAGAVFDVPRGELYAAALGAGATRNGERIAPSAVSDPEMALVGTGFNYTAAERARQALAVAWMLPQVRDIRRGGSAALDLCWVASGRLDGYFERGLHRWDSAAATLIVREAGAAAGQLPDETWVAANRALFGPLCDLVRTAIGEASAAVG